MARSRAILGAVRGFLGTFTSRYSAFNGYWLFGFAVERVSCFEVDLASDAVVEDEDEPLAVTRALARVKFREQMQKHGVEAIVDSATLLIEISPDGIPARPRWRRNAWPVRFTVRAQSTRGAEISDSLLLQIAPHDASAEMRSAGKS